MASSSNMLKYFALLSALLALLSVAYSMPVDEQSDLSSDANIDSELDDLIAKYIVTKFRLEQELDRQTDGVKSEGGDHLVRDRRRINVFKNIYNQCRIQKRKEKNFCLYLANLYQNVKGFHGI